MANWISGAIKHPGALHKMLHVPAGEKIPASKMAAARHSKNPLERRRAALAKTLSGFHHGKGGPKKEEEGEKEDKNETRAQERAEEKNEADGKGGPKKCPTCGK